MNNLTLKPTLNAVVEDNNILWFKLSNKYIVINSIVNELITFFLYSNSYEQFEGKVLNHTDFSKSEIFKFYNDISVLLEECNQTPAINKQITIAFNKSLRPIDIYYCISILRNNFLIDINSNTISFKIIFIP